MDFADSRPLNRGVSRIDAADARLVRNLFEDRDHDVLLLRLSQRMTNDFLGTLLQKEIQARDWLVVVSSENAQWSSWVEFQETYARKRAKPVFCIHLEECSHLSGEDRANRIGTQVSRISRLIRVFMSYHREDMDIARRLAADLTARGLEVWLDLTTMPVGGDFREEISRAIDRTLENGAMVVLVSEKSMESKWVLEELNYALAQEERIVPCLMGPQPPNMPAELQHIQWIDLTGTYEEGFQWLLRALGH